VTEIQLKHWSESDQKAIRHQLDRILNSGPFHQSQRRQRFLEYLVNETLAGRGERLKAYNVALEVFDRPETFDPVIDPLVRIEAARLRDKLREYYAGDGQRDPILIDLPKGTYTPHIEFRHEGAPLGRRNVLQEQDVSSTVPSVAVLPFDDLSAHQNLGYLGDGVAEDIITALYYSALTLSGFGSCRPQFLLHLQGQGRRCAAGRKRTWRRLRARRQRPQRGRQASYRRSAH
jgi:hypothetical protein